MQNSSFFIIKPIIIKIWDKKEFKQISTRDTVKRKQKKRITAYRKKAVKNFAKEILYLQIIAENKTKNQTAYDNRKLVKAGERESCKQRKRRLRKEYLAKKKSKQLEIN